jgi:hypothetical protein
MTLNCSICGKAFKEGDDVRATMDSYWHILGSRVLFSITQPHNINQDSLRHVSCEEELLEKAQE